MTYQLLLTLHIIAGTISLFSALGSVAIKMWDLPHKWHLYFGRTFFAGMIVIFVTAILMSLIKPNLFLLLIAIFSFYFAFSGWRYARNRSGKPALIDRLSVSALILATVVMLCLGAYKLWNQDSDGVTLIVFGIISAGFSWIDWRNQQQGGVTGNKRIARHLTMMLGGTIATITAVITVNFTFEPAFVLWLAPTVLIVPLITWWNRKLLKP